jgi:polyhydroxyalkanoate synthesis regulator phasin
MKDLLKKGFYVGLGAGLLLKDEIMKVLNAPVKVNDKPLEDLRRVLKNISENVGQGVETIKGAGQEEVGHLLDQAGLARSQDVEALQKRIDELEAQLRKKQQDGAKAAK